jgi:hypothetical protein
VTRLGRPWPMVIVGSCIAVALCNWLDVGQPARAVVVFWFFLTCPGLALVGMLGIRDWLDEAIVAIALSFALATGVATIMVMAKLWSPDAGLAILIAISLLGAVLQLAPWLRRGLARSGGREARGPVA